MTQIKDLAFNEIRAWVHSEVSRGRSEKEVVAELAEKRQDVVLLSANSTPEEIYNRIIEAVQLKSP